MSTPEYHLVRVWKKTHQMLRFIVAFTGESIIEAIDRLASQELQRLEAERPLRERFPKREEE
jgi:hypothetical protein